MLYNSINELCMTLMLHNAAVLSVDVISHQVTCNFHHEWRVGKNLHGGGNGQFKSTSTCLTLWNTYDRFRYTFPTVFASQPLVIATKLLAS
jgi:hypothetical protein